MKSCNIVLNRRVKQITIVIVVVLQIQIIQIIIKGKKAFWIKIIIIIATTTATIIKQKIILNKILIKMMKIIKKL